MNLEIAIVLIILVLNLALGLIVLLKGPQKKINRLFAATVLSIIIWISAYFLENWGLSEQTSKFFLKMDFAFAGIVSYFWLIFCINLPRDFLPKNKFYALYLVIIPLIFTALSFTNLIASSPKVVNEVIIFERGFLYFPYAFFIFSYMLGGCLVLFYKYKKVDRAVQRQIIYILVGALLTLLGVLFITLILPQISEISVSIARLGIYSILFLVGLTAYAIVETHLFDIRVIATELLVVLIGLALLIDTLLSKTLLEGGLKGILFVLVSYGSYKLVQSVKEEIRRRQEIQKLTTKLKKANVRLQELDRMKSEFLSVASHELNSPMSIIKGYLHMILWEGFGKVDKNARTYLEKVYMKTDQLAKLVADLLNVSRIEQGGYNWI